jgi:lysozyme
MSMTPAVQAGTSLWPGSRKPNRESTRHRPRAIRAVIAGVLLLGLGACGGSQPDAARSYQPPTRALAFGDMDPHDWSGVTPAHHAVHGIDVSRWQGQIDWQTVRGAGIDFAYIKATEGGDRVDPMFRQNWAEAARAGMPRGAYHYYYFCRPAEEQARWFIANVPRDPLALPPVLDMEWNHLSRTCTYRPDGVHVRAEADKFLDILTAYYGHRPIVYTTVDFHRDTDIGYLRDTEFWFRSVANHPSVTYPGRNWSFWQYTSTGVIPGVSTPVDINVFAGSAGTWSQWRQMRMARY